MKNLFLILLLAAAPSFAQIPTTPPLIASNFGHWTVPANNPVNAPGMVGVFLQFSQVTASSGPSFAPVTLNTPLLILDAGNNETVIPTAVSCPVGGIQCTFTATFTKAHLGGFQVSSGTYGLQEAINYLIGSGGTVQITSDWPGSTSMITALNGNANVSIQDIRNGLTVYVWTGTVYAPPVQGFAPLCGSPSNPGIPIWNGTACVVDPNATLDGNGNLNLATVTASRAITAPTVATTGPGGVITVTSQAAPGTPAVNQYYLYVDSTSGVLTCLNHVLGNACPGSGGGPTLQTNGVNNSSQAALNFINPTTFNGLTATFSNPGGAGNETFTFGGTLGNAGLTNPFTTVNGQTCTLGSTCSIPPGSPACSVIGSSDTITSAGPFSTTCSLSNTGLAVGSIVEIRAHGLLTTTGTSTPLENMEVNAFGTTGICQHSGNSLLTVSSTNLPWDVVCYVQIVTTGNPGTAIAWGHDTPANSVGGTDTVDKIYCNANPCSAVLPAAITTSAQTVSIQETATMVAGQSFTLQSLIVRNY